MAYASKTREKALQADRQIRAARRLLSTGFPHEAVVLAWAAARATMFAWLEERHIAFYSTRSALVASMRHDDLRSARADLAFLHAVATSAEWDEAFEITEIQAEDILHICGGTIEALRASMREEKA